MRTINIYLVRHGKVCGEAALYGRTDVLVDSEKQQAICKAWRDLELPVERLITSPLKRCADLASLLVAAQPQLRPEVVESFQEMDFGIYDGVSFDKLGQQWEQLEQFWQKPGQYSLPQAESLQDFYSRVVDGWQHLIEDIDHDTLLICHGGTIRMILAHVLGLDCSNAKLFSVLQIGNQSLTHLRITIAEQHYVQVCSIGTPLINS